MCNFRNTKSMVTIFALELFFRMFTFGKVWFWEQASPAYLFTWTSHLGHETPITAFVLLPRPTKMMLKTSMLKRNIMQNILKCFFLKWTISGLFFLYLHLFNTVDSKEMFNKCCQWLDSNRGPLVLEVTTLPTEPQPLPLFSFFTNIKFTEKTEGFRGIRTRIVGFGGQHSDHLTTTTALKEKSVQHT